MLYKLAKPGGGIEIGECQDEHVPEDAEALTVEDYARIRDAIRPTTAEDVAAFMAQKIKPKS